MSHADLYSFPAAEFASMPERQQIQKHRRETEAVRKPCEKMKFNYFLLMDN